MGVGRIEGKIKEYAFCPGSSELQVETVHGCVKQN